MVGNIGQSSWYVQQGTVICVRSSRNSWHSNLSNLPSMMTYSCATAGTLCYEPLLHASGIENHSQKNSHLPPERAYSQPFWFASWSLWSFHKQFVVSINADSFRAWTMYVGVGKLSNLFKIISGHEGKIIIHAMKQVNLISCTGTSSILLKIT